MNKETKLIISVLMPLTVGSLGGYFTASSVSGWYLYLDKPFFNPPSWIFGPVWTMLYILMGVSFYIVWQKKWGKQKEKVFNLYFGQLALNFLWSLFFFGAKSPILALLDIFILWYFIFSTILLFHKIDRIAAYLLIPYILWVSFATLLNFSIFILN